MNSFSYEWDIKGATQDSKLPNYTKNARKKLKKSLLYISLWGCLKNSAYIYTRHFHNWEIYILFITRTFPKLKINDIREDLTELLREFYIIHNNENMCTTGSTPNTNEVLNAFLEILSSISTD